MEVRTWYLVYQEATWLVLTYDNNVIVGTWSMVNRGWYSDYKWSIVGNLVLSLRRWIVVGTECTEGYEAGTRSTDGINLN